ncbi:S66 family peptidase [Cytobacillus gottheilii]|uniref:S66 family peptidase n=1 Tax=Cytobacillus gottheilii TaxID=859144 RepID=UPI0009B98A93|nr:S66 peptidase family protein [Cytobacillus gottheilii]
MITYPEFHKNGRICITAPSSGVPESMHQLLRQAIQKMQNKGYAIQAGETSWTQKKAKSAEAKKRAHELNTMLNDPSIQLIFPPWGGELLLEIIDLIDYESIKPKWILGYSDISLLLFVITLKTGMATAHGTNLIDLRGTLTDDVTAKWEEVLLTKRGERIDQVSSQHYQKSWQHENPSPAVFHLTEKTEWKTLEEHEELTLKGRLLGGCIDVIRHVIGTPYGDIRSFQNNDLKNERILWYFENCEMTTTDLRRTFIQMKLAGWFEHAAGIVFGRSSANETVDGYRIEDFYKDLKEDVSLPIFYDVDCGHVPPQMTFVNGAKAEITIKNGKGKLSQSFV